MQLLTSANDLSVFMSNIEGLWAPLLLWALSVISPFASFVFGGFDCGEPIFKTRRWSKSQELKRLIVNIQELLFTWSIRLFTTIRSRDRLRNVGFLNAIFSFSWRMFVFLRCFAAGPSSRSWWDWSSRSRINTIYWFVRWHFSRHFYQCIK